MYVLHLYVQSMSESLCVLAASMYVCMYVCMYNVTYRSNCCIILNYFSSSNGSSESTKSIFIGAEYLAAASDALLFLCERVFKLGECATLTAIKHRLSDLFIRLSILVYSQVRTHSIMHTYSRIGRW